MEYWVTTLVVVLIYNANCGSTRWLPDREFEPIGLLCPSASLECCKYQENSREYMQCCEKYGCCQPCSTTTENGILGTYELRQDCASAWECCRYEFLSMAFQKCCNDHGCCPLCGQLWSAGCFYNGENYSFGTVMEYQPKLCVKLQCVAEVSRTPPYLNAAVIQMFYNPGSFEPNCQSVHMTKCVDNFGISRSEGEEWFVSATCEQCSCQVGDITCRPVRRPCPPPPHPNCIAVAHGCCPMWDCDGKSKGCISHDGIRIPYGETWWDSEDKCVYNKCTESGVQRLRKTCPELPPQPSHSCKRVYDETKCCETWQCSDNCPDPNSFGRFCITYIDQCRTDDDCQSRDYESGVFFCCLVGGCGHECMSTCVDVNGIVRRVGETWLDPANPNRKLICTTEGTILVDGGPSGIPGTRVPPRIEDMGGDKFPLPMLPTSPYDCLFRSGLNLTALGEDLETLTHLTLALPLKDTRFFVDGFQTLETTGLSSQSLNDQQIFEIRTRAAKFDWSAVLPLLNVDTASQQSVALSAGDLNLQSTNAIATLISEKNDALEKESPSTKHQVAFRRTDPIATQMANLGPVMETATHNFIRSFDLPSFASGALPLLGEASDCSRRFITFLRPTLAPTCDPNSPFRTFDGTCNNLNNDLWGAAFTKFRRLLPQAYGDDVSSLRRAADGQPLPSARLVSTKINTKPNVDDSTLSILHMTFGQFLDHDLTATPIAKGNLGGPVKCCDELHVKLTLAAINLNNTKIAIEAVKLTEPSLTTTNLLGELNVTTRVLQELILNGRQVLPEPFEDILSARPPRQATTDFTSILIPLRPQSGQCAPIQIPSDDPFYSDHGQNCMEFVRSIAAPMCAFGPREQLNQHTAYLDGSVIYGVKKETTDALRQFEDGLLKVQVTLGNKILLPAEVDPDDGCNVDEHYDNDRFCFKTGDGRVNEQVLLTLYQTVWAREHNRVAKILKSFNNVGWDDERLFQETRRIVVAELQHVTFKEYLPSVLGNVLMTILQLNPLTSDQYTMDYDDELEASIANSFATAAYRFGHSQIADFIQRVNQHGVIHTQPLSTLFFHPFSFYEDETVEELARGGTFYPSRKVDAYFTEEVTGKLFRGHEPYGLDLVALNLQRGRDHGIPGYVEWKSLCGLPVAEFSDLTTVMEPSIVDALEDVYDALEDIDLYIGGVAERPFLDAILGPTFSCIIADQFVRIKKGDRFWYEYKDSPGAFGKAQLKQLHKVTFARILCNNIPELIRIQPEPLKNPSSTNPRVACSSHLIPNYSLSPWEI